MSIKLKPNIYISWIPYGRIHLHPVIYASVLQVHRAEVTVRADTLRKCTWAKIVHADTLRRMQPSKTWTVSADTARRIGKGKTAAADTSRRLVKTIRTIADTSIIIPHMLRYAAFGTQGIRSFSVTLGELTLSDSIRFETVHPLAVGESIRGRVMDYVFDCTVEETSQRGIVQSVKGAYSKEELLYTPISIHVEQANISFYAKGIASALGLKLHRRTDDFIPSQNFEESGMTYRDFISSLFGWTAKLPRRQVNVFIRGGTLYMIQRGMEETAVDITGWPHTPPTVERKRIRSLWHSAYNDESMGAHNEKATAPIPFTGTIAHDEISRKYVNGFLVRETNENGITTYTYADEYLTAKETRNKDGSASRTDYSYAKTGRDAYLFKEREVTIDAVEDGKKIPPAYDWVNLRNTPHTERITYHSPLGYGWYATTVCVDGAHEGSALSQGKPGNKASRFTVEQSHLSLGGRYREEETLPYTSLIDTEFPVEGEEYLKMLTREIEWMDRKTQETVSVEIRLSIRDGVPEIGHIVDFTERIRFEGCEYFLQSNTVELTPRLLRQTLKMVRWY